MAGRKHHLQQLGHFSQKGFNHIEDPIERDLAFRSMQVDVHCKICGEVIIDSQEDKDGMKANWEYELQVGAHMACINKERMKRSQGRG